MAGGTLQLLKAQKYSLYVLLILMIAFLFNQLDRFALGIVSKPMAQEIHFGDKVCMTNHTLKESTYPGIDDFCKNITSEDICVASDYNISTYSCQWNYDGSGLEYQIVAGPVFIVIYTLAGIPLGFAADQYSRKTLLSICAILWSLMILLMGFVQNYWQLVLTRFGLGIWEAGCTPFAASLIADYFDTEMRASAIGVYNWGIYIGYSLSYAVGNFITEANINDQGWRWSMFLPAIPGFVVGVIIFFTVKEPQRKATSGKAEGNINVSISKLSKIKLAAVNFMRPSVLLLCFAGSIRNAGGYVWAYNTEPYFVAIKQTRHQIGVYMSWIPLVGGSLGVVLGGFISDRIVKKRGLYARVIVLVVSQLVAAPFAAGALFLDPPWAYISLIPSNIFGEMWIGVCMTVVVELIPSSIRTTGIAIYLLIISNIGGNIPLLVPPFTEAFQNMGYSKADALRGALYILFPGLYVAGSLLFLLTMFVLKRDAEKAKRDESTYQQLQEDTQDR